MFHSKTTQKQPFKAENFFRKVLKFQQYDVVIYGVSVDFGSSFGMWYSL